MVDFIRDTSLDKQKIEENVDMSKVEAIVNRLKKKYEKEGILEGVDQGHLKELRSIIAEGKRAQIEILKPSDLRYDFNKNIKKIGQIYVSFEKFFKLIIDKIYNLFPIRRMLAYELYSANINYSTNQYLAITVVLSTLFTLITGILSFSLFSFLDISLIYALFITIFSFFIYSLIILSYPSSVAKSRAKAIDKELPFALRHMATELRAGVGIYKVLRSIAVAKYGILSEEIAKTITEIEEGAETKDALKNLGLRTKSYALKNTINHLLRALKSGGNLSDVLNRVAEDVSFNLRLEIESFAEKMNFFGVIYIFLGIVTPVMIGVLGGIRNAPIGGKSFFAALPLTPLTITIIMAVILPIMLFTLVFYIKSIRPAM